MVITFTDEIGLEKLDNTSNPDEAFNDNMELIDLGGTYKVEAGENLSKGEWVRQSGATVVKAQADSTANAMVLGIVTADVSSGDDAYIRYAGVLNKSGWGLTGATQYYLDPSTPGAMTTTRPTGSDKTVELGEPDNSGDKFYIRIRIYNTIILGGDHSTLNNLEWSNAGHTIDTNVSFGSNNALYNDNFGPVLGTGGDALIYYNGTDMVIDANWVGSGILKISSAMDMIGNAIDMSDGSITDLAGFDGGGDAVICTDDFALNVGGKLILNADDSSDNYWKTTGDNVECYRQGSRIVNYATNLNFFPPGSRVAFKNAGDIYLDLEDTSTSKVWTWRTLSGTSMTFTLNGTSGTEMQISSTTASYRDTGMGIGTGADAAYTLRLWKGISAADDGSSTSQFGGDVDMLDNSITDLAGFDGGGDAVLVDDPLTIGDYAFIVDTTTLVVNASGYTDKVGIMTATPNRELHVNGIVLVGSASDISNTANGDIEFRSGSPSQFWTDSSEASGSRTFRLQLNGGNLAYKSQNDTGTANVVNNILTMNHTTGYVGMGTASATAPVHINSSGSGNKFLVTNGTESEIRFFVQVTAGDDAFFGMNDTTNTNKVVIRTDGASFFNGGNVGIGKTPLTYALEVLGACELTVPAGLSGSTRGYRIVTIDGGGFSIYNNNAVANPDWYFNVNGGETFNFTIGGTPYITVDASGLSLLVGDFDMGDGSITDLEGFDGGGDAVLAGDDIDMDFNDSIDLATIDNSAVPADLDIDCGTNKTIELQQVVYDDMRTPVNAVRLAGAQPPAETAYRGGMVLAFTDVADKSLYFNVQLPHEYKEGDDLEMHIHYALPTAGAGGGAENVKWDLTHSWSNIDAAIPVESTVNQTIDVQSLSANTHYRGQIVATISGTGKNISSMLICSITRDTGVANNYSDDVYVLEVDFHITKNTMGSRQAGTK
jgi:hypothetical protein